MITFMINHKIKWQKYIIIAGVYDFLLKTQLLVSGYIYNFKLILNFWVLDNFWDL